MATTRVAVPITAGNGTNIATVLPNANATAGDQQIVSIGDPDDGNRQLAIDANGAAKINQTAPSSTDGSTTITAGNTAQNLFGGTTPTNGYEVVNPDATEDLWISDSTTAAANATGAIRVAANGGCYTTPVGYKPLGAVSIVGATTGHKITARRW